jgi:hypothetical protein
MSHLPKLTQTFFSFSQMSVRGSAEVLRAMLERGRQSLASSSLPRHLLVGNEAADADSCVSALAHSLFLAGQGGGREEVLVPLLSCPRSDFALRREASVILGKWLGASTAQALLFVDDVPSPPAAGDRVTLLDHNRLKGPLAALQWAPAVAGILDHHLDEGSHPQVAGEARCIDFDAAAQRGVGSTCSLVALRLLGSPALDAPLAEALLSVIALDTINMLPSKATPRDEAAVAGLLGVLNSSSSSSSSAAGGSGGGGAATAPPAPTLDSLFTHLNSLRSDRQWWLGLQPEAALGLDYKGFERLGTSALMLSAVDFLAGGQGGALQPHRLAAALAFGRARGVAVLALMSQVTSPEVARELVLLPVAEGSGEQSVQALVAALAGERGAQFELHRLQLQGSPPGMAAFQQRNLAHTRKTLAPFLAAALAALG